MTQVSDWQKIKATHRVPKLNHSFGPPCDGECIAVLTNLFGVTWSSYWACFGRSLSKLFNMVAPSVCMR